MFDDKTKSCQLAKKDPMLLALSSAPTADVYNINIKPGTPDASIYAVKFG